MTKTAETPDTKRADVGEAADAAHVGQQLQQASAEEPARHGQPVPAQAWQHLSAILSEHFSFGEHLFGGSLRPLRVQEA